MESSFRIESKTVLIRIMGRFVLIAVISVFLCLFQAFFFDFDKKNKLTSRKVLVTFFSKTEDDNIKANNYKAIATLDVKSGMVVFSIPMQSFEFEKAMFQRYYNSTKFLNTKNYPRTKFVGKINNLKEINFDVFGKYQTRYSGNLTIRGETRQIHEKGTLTISKGSVTMKSSFLVKLSDFKIATNFGIPDTKVSKTVEIYIEAIF